MKIRNQLFLLSLAALGLGACSEDNPWASGRGEGKIDLQLSASADIKDALPIVRAGAPDLIAPDASDFAISLKNLDTDEVRTWQTLEEFNAEKGFAVGSYTLTAYYGSVHEFGFYKPYFVGETNVTVLEGRESSAEVVAQLGNAMLSVDYTEAFKNYFQDYYVTVQNQGEGSFIFTSGESRPGFVAPGTVSLNLNATNPFDLSDKEKKPISLARFAVQARHHYHVTIDVEGVSGVGYATLKVIFDDNVEQEDVTISLTEELFTTEGPKINPDGFTDGAVVEALSGNDSPNPLKFDISCKGGIKSAKLTVGGEHNLPFREVELVNASEGMQAMLEQNGVKVTGIFGNESEFACVNVTGLSKYLPEGNFPVSVSVTDLADRVTDPITVNISTRPITLKFIEGSAIYATPSTSQKNIDATVFVSYNGMNPETCISFKHKCQYGEIKDCDIVSVIESTRTRAFEEKTYMFHIRMCDAKKSPHPMEMYFNGVKYGDDFTIDVVEPEYTLEADAFATYVKIKVNYEDPTVAAAVVNGLSMTVDGNIVENSVNRNPEQHYLTISDLTSGVRHEIGCSLTENQDGSANSKKIDIKTEAASQVTNNNFASKETTINMTNINAGGEYQYGSTHMQNKSSIVIETPKNWATLNPLTCWPDAKNKNTWFCVPSTLMENGAVVIRTVAYDHNGTSPANDNHGLSVRAKYSRNMPASFASKSSGELFLGSYSFNGTANRTDGIAFTSRPTSMTFNYEYSPVAGEVGEVYIALTGAGGAILVESSADIKANENTMTVTLPEYPFGKEATGIRISFKSSKTVIDVPMPSDIADVTNTTGLSGQTIAANKYKSLCVGSKLILHNVTLNY